MSDVKTNKMADTPMKKLFWKMGLPMIVSMILQALYNVVDSVFVTNMGAKGALANQALTLAFPIQILIIAVGVGTGVGLNALLARILGENEKEKANRVAGNGIILGIIIFIVFLLFGLFGSRWFISLFAGGNSEVIEMGTTYLKICCCFSLGSIGYTVYERFLQSTGKTILSTIAQISGALTNIVLDYVFIFPLGMGVAGAAWATIIGQFVSLILAMIFHYTKNKEIDGSVKYIKLDISIIKEIYSIGVSAALMQGLLAVMMAGVNAILGISKADPVVLVGSFGIYYKIQQIALFAAFGLSNTIISILSFNYGMKDKKRSKDCIKYGIVDTLIVTLVITVLFELFARPLSNLFGLTGDVTEEIITTCTMALRIASIGYIFTLSDNVINIVWRAFPIAEILTAFISFLILKKTYKEKISILRESKIIGSAKKLIITISREHGTNGKEIGRKVADRLGLNFYDKEEMKEYALKHSLTTNNTEELYRYYLSLDVEKDSIIKQAEIIKKISEEGDSVIVGRASDFILRDNKNVVKIFLYASLDYRINKVKEIYKDDYKTAKKNVLKSDKSRSTYYEVISNQKWRDMKNYDLCLNCEIGNDKIIKTICDYVGNRLN